MTARRPPRSLRGLEDLGRTRLSHSFFLRDFLYSEIAALHGIANIPDTPARAVAHGRALCTTLLEPLHQTFGGLAIRSGYRCRALNDFGNARRMNCAASDNPLECHVWDRPDIAIAGACVVIPWFADQAARGRDWRDLAWWLMDHLPVSELCFFPRLCAFNIGWRPVPLRRVDSYVAPRGCLLRPGADPPEARATRQARYTDFPPLRAAPELDRPGRLP